VFQYRGYTEQLAREGVYSSPNVIAGAYAETLRAKRASARSRYSKSLTDALQVPLARNLFFWERHAGTDHCSRMEQSSAQYRKFAEECRRLTKFVQTADERKVLQEMEAAWTKVAEEDEGEAGKNCI
jgi:hypothetical protein